MLPLAPSVHFTRACYIKLGKGGEWEEECLLLRQQLRLAYRDVPHDLCQGAQWNAVRDHLQVRLARPPGVATSDTRQIRLFYEASEDLLWITFFRRHLWWGFAKAEVSQLADGTKVRAMLSPWRRADATDQPLHLGRLPGKLLALQGFRGTLCELKPADVRDLRFKVNGRPLPEVEAVLVAHATLEAQLATLVRRLTWRDFELLVDLIFRQAGYQRVGKAGGTDKDVDLDLLLPLTGERYQVQVKSAAGLEDWERFHTECAQTSGYARGYFVVHSPEGSLPTPRPEDRLQLWGVGDVARLALRYGLARWVVDKTS